MNKENVINGIKERLFKNCELRPSEVLVLKDYINQLETKINTYENPEDMTLMFMWCDEKAKDKIKQLETNIDEAIEILKLCNSQCSKDAISILERGKE